MPKPFILALLFLTVQIGVDAYMGDAAEYFNAWYVVLAFVEMFTQSNGTALNFIVGQAELGLTALPIALAVLIVVPWLFASLINAMTKVFTDQVLTKRC